MHTNAAVERLSYLLDDCEAKSDALAVHLCCALKLAEASKNMIDLGLLDSDTRVLHAYTQFRLCLFEEDDDGDKAFFRELYSVLHQVHEDLLDSPAISD